MSAIFTRQVVEAMARLNDRPIIFALSNPTEHAECTAEEAYQWSKGKALYAAGVQFMFTSRSTAASCKEHVRGHPRGLRVRSAG